MLMRPRIAVLNQTFTRPGCLIQYPLLKVVIGCSSAVAKLSPSLQPPGKN
jgi:hypothetical protein